SDSAADGGRGLPISSYGCPQREAQSAPIQRSGESRSGTYGPPWPSFCSSPSMPGLSTMPGRKTRSPTARSSDEATGSEKVKIVSDLAIKLLVVTIYLFVMLGIGFYGYRRTGRDPVSYFLANRGLGTILLL